MISFTLLAIVLASFILSTLGDDSASYTDGGITFQGQRDSNLGITIGFVFPPANEVYNPPEFITQIKATSNTVKWSGIALFGNMVNNLLIVAWPNPAGNNVVVSARYTTTYALPGLYDGPTLTTISQNYSSNGLWSVTLRCQNCTTWRGGGLNVTGIARISYAKGGTAPANPAMNNSTITRHTNIGQITQNMDATKSSRYKSYLPVVTTTKTTSTTSRTSTTNLVSTSTSVTSTTHTSTSLTSTTSTSSGTVTSTGIPASSLTSSTSTTSTTAPPRSTIAL